MGQRPIGNSQYSLSEEAVSALCSGDVRALLDFHKGVFGGFRMEDDNTDDVDDDGDSDDNDDDTEDGDDDSGDEDSGDSKGKDPKLKALHDENSRRRNENKTLRKTLTDLEDKLKQYTDADKSDLDKVTGERDELKTRVEKLASTNQSLALQVAFLQDNSHTWHNPKAALKLLDMSGVEIDDDGEVTGLGDAIKALAKDNPYLLKKADKDDDSESGAPKSSGQPPSKKAAAARRAVEDKYRLGR